MSGFSILSSKKTTASEAITEIASQINTPNSFSIIFFSDAYDREQIIFELGKQLPKNTVAVSTAGEICNGQFSAHSISGISFESSFCSVYPFLIESVSKVNVEELVKIKSFADSISVGTFGSSKNKFFCSLLIDGMSGQEESVTEILSSVIGNLPLIGGSSGDGLNFSNTSMYYNGQSYKNSAVLLFMNPKVPFEIIKTQHFEISDKKMVVTDSKPEERLVLELNGRPAALEFADTLGVKVDQLDSLYFSKNPVGVKINKYCYVRSIRNKNPDNSLKFYCAIETGIVLSTLSRKDIVDHIVHELDAGKTRIRQPSLSLFFECILRRLEILSLPESRQKELYNFYKSINAVGFHTYGEQYNSLHINQTLTGVIFGKG